MIPKGWHEVTVNQFRRIDEIQKSERENKEIEIFMVLCDLDDMAIDNIALTELNDIAEKTAWAKTLPEQTKIPQWVKVDGKLFHVEHRINKIKAGQYIDLKTYMKQPVNENLHKILTCFILPCDKKGNPLKYSADTIEELSEFFDTKMTVDIAYPLALFFCNLYPRLIEATQDYTEGKLSRQMKSLLKELESEAKKVTRSGGVGSWLLKPWQRLKGLSLTK